MTNRRRRCAIPRSFTLTELLVVIALIALLVGLVLGGVGKAREAGRRAQTLATMTAFANACEAFRLEHGMLPGPIPEPVLAYHNHEVAHGYSNLPVSGTENALLHLLGGYAVYGEVPLDYWNSLSYADGWRDMELLTPDGDGFMMRVNPNLVGQGPFIGGRALPPYLEPSDALRTVDADPDVQWRGDGESNSDVRLPDLVDGWGNPILCIRRARTFGPMGGSAHGDVIGHAPIKPHFYVESAWPYVRTDGQMWDDPCQGGDGRGSILSTREPSFGGFDEYLTHMGLSQVLRHPSLDPVTDPRRALTVRGDFLVISAGPDGIYFSAADGPGTPARPIGSNGCEGYEAYSYQDFIDEGPELIETFDDLITGG